MRKDIIVIGTSAGGIEALRILVSALPKHFGASVFVVLHTSPHSPGILGAILERAGHLPAITVKNRERIEPGRIYVPSPDYHLVIEPGTARATRGPKENRFRPAVDPLFRSAAQTYGPRVIGVVLTGGLDDGTAGLWAVKQLGGTAVVQDPEDALVPSMPRNALNNVAVDHCLPLEQIAPLLVRLARETADEQGARVVPDKIEIEVSIAKEETALNAGVLKLGEPSNYACPECHGVLLQMKEDKRIRFRCHTGHAYSAESLMAEINEAVNDSLWNAIRSVEESALLMRHLSQHAVENGNTDNAQEFQTSAQAALRRAELVRQAVLDHTGSEGLDPRAADPAQETA
jgi:two-component system, chemotaxis family, protein-glutamate methylesterase/glutaminase